MQLEFGVMIARSPGYAFEHQYPVHKTEIDNWGTKILFAINRRNVPFASTLLAVKRQDSKASSLLSGCNAVDLHRERFSANQL